jgi:ABC-type dipeptide/oligopeptide/nickel transport system permease component
MEEMGKWLILLGVLLVIIGGAMVLIGKVPGIGRLPGDIVFQRDNMTCFFPIATSILLSIVLTVLLNIILRIINR